MAGEKSSVIGDWMKSIWRSRKKEEDSGSEQVGSPETGGDLEAMFREYLSPEAEEQDLPEELEDWIARGLSEHLIDPNDPEFAGQEIVPADSLQNLEYYREVSQKLIQALAEVHSIFGNQFSSKLEKKRARLAEYLADLQTVLDQGRDLVGNPGLTDGTLLDFNALGFVTEGATAPQLDAIPARAQKIIERAYNFFQEILPLIPGAVEAPESGTQEESEFAAEEPIESEEESVEGEEGEYQPLTEEIYRELENLGKEQGFDLQTTALNFIELWKMAESKGVDVQDVLDMSAAKQYRKKVKESAKQKTPAPKPEPQQPSAPPEINVIQSDKADKATMDKIYAIIKAVGNKNAFWRVVSGDQTKIQAGDDAILEEVFARANKELNLSEADFIRVVNGEAERRAANQG